MPSSPDAPQIFSLQAAVRLLPDVKHLTADAVRQAESLAAKLRGLTDDDPEYARLSAGLQEVVDGWTAAVRSLGLEAKGPWLVDFDNGEGYYCWCYPEASVAYYHGYDEGFTGRTRIQ
jgi:hypothetical protein